MTRDELIAEMQRRFDDQEKSSRPITDVLTDAVIIMFGVAAEQIATLTSVLVAGEREACAEIVDQMRKGWASKTGTVGMVSASATETILEAIRARGSDTA